MDEERLFIVRVIRIFISFSENREWRVEERLFIVAYDIADQRRWRRVFKAMHGFGEWLQLSIFQCRLSRRRRAELETRLRELVKNGEDHVLLIDVGPADKIELVMESIGKTFKKMERRAVVI